MVYTVGMVKDDANRNGRITSETPVSLRLVIGLVFFTALVVVTWADLRMQIVGVHHKIDLLHQPAMKAGTH